MSRKPSYLASSLPKSYRPKFKEIKSDFVQPGEKVRYVLPKKREKNRWKLSWLYRDARAKLDNESISREMLNVEKQLRTPFDVPAEAARRRNLLKYRTLPRDLRCPRCHAKKISLRQWNLERRRCVSCARRDSSIIKVEQFAPKCVFWHETLGWILSGRELKRERLRLHMGTPRFSEMCGMNERHLRRLERTEAQVREKCANSLLSGFAAVQREAMERDASDRDPVKDLVTKEEDMNGLDLPPGYKRGRARSGKRKLSVWTMKRRGATIRLGVSPSGPAVDALRRRT